MSNRKSIKPAAKDFLDRVQALDHFVAHSILPLSDEEQTWCYDYVIIRLHREFEEMILAAIIEAIHEDPSTIAASTGIVLPRQLNDDICECLVLGGEGFDFNSRESLLKRLKRYLSDDHHLMRVLKQPKYRDTLERLTALRDYALHGHYQSQHHAFKVLGVDRLDAAGDWLKQQGRFKALSRSIRELGQELHDVVPN